MISKVMVSSPLSALARGAMRTASSRAVDRMHGTDLVRMAYDVWGGGGQIYSPQRKLNGYPIHAPVIGRVGYMSEQEWSCNQPNPKRRPGYYV